MDLYGNHSNVSGWQELFFSYKPSNFRRLLESWDDVISTTLVFEKFDIFIDTLKDAVDKFLPIEKTYASDKPWITGKIKSLIAKRQKRLKFGKDSQTYKEARNAVQKECENCKKCF